MKPNKLEKTVKTLLPILALIYSLGLSINASAKVAADESNFAAAAFEPSALRVYYVDYYASHLKFPSSIETLGLNPSDFQTENIDGITINKSNGAILVELSHIFGEKQWLSLIPVTNNIGSIDSFICQTTVNAEIVGDLDCRSGVPYESVDTIVDSSFFLNTLIAAASIRLDFNEHVQSQGVFPTDVSQFGINDAWLENANINNVIVNPSQQ